MRIAIDARESGTTTGRYVDKLIDNLQKIDHENQYVLLYKTDRIEKVVLTAKNFQKIPTKYKEFSFGEQLGFAWQLYRLKADLVHFPLVQHPVLYFGKSVIGVLDLTTLRFYNPAKNRLVFWIKQRIYSSVIWMAVRKARHIVTISNFVRDDIVKNFHANPAKITTTYNAADDLPEPAKKVDELDGKRFIMYVGRHQPHKNLPRLMDAHQKLLDPHPDLHLAIVGKPDKTTALLKQKVEQDRYKNIVFTGFVTDNQLRWLYENTACYVFPSLSEGFGLPGLEAMVHEAPVASSNATCLPEVYGDAAHYFDPMNTDDIADKIAEILNNKTLRSSLIPKGKKQARKYSWKNMAEQTLRIYKSA